MKRKRYKIAKLIGSLIITYGILSIYGIAGSSDLGLASFEQIFKYSIIGIISIIFGIMLIAIATLFQNKYNKRIREEKLRRNTYNKFIRDMAKLEV